LETDKISIRDLLRQKSGMHDYFPNVFTTLKERDLKSELAELTFKEDKKFQYSNVNYHLLSLILKRVYQKELNELIAEKIWLPLNLTQGKVVNRNGYCCIFTTARSWLEIGKLFLNHGVYQNRQIVSKFWLDKMRNDKVQPESCVVQVT